MEMQEIQGVALVANEDTILRQFSEQKQRLMDFSRRPEDIIPTLLSANGIEVANISSVSKTRIRCGKRYSLSANTSS